MPKKKNKQASRRARIAHLVRMMLERFASVRLFDVRLVTIARDAENLVVVLRLAALERGLGTLKLSTERAHVAVRALELGLLERGAEVRDRVFVLLLVQPDARTRAKRFEGAGLERERSFGVDEGVVVSGELPVTRRKGRERDVREIDTKKKCVCVCLRRTLTRVVARFESNNARNCPPFPSSSFSPTRWPNREQIQY